MEKKTTVIQQFETAKVFELTKILCDLNDRILRMNESILKTLTMVQYHVEVSSPDISGLSRKVKDELSEEMKRDLRMSDGGIVRNTGAIV